MTAADSYGAVALLQHAFDQQDWRAVQHRAVFMEQFGENGAQRM
jgi:hypothetical protein